MIVYLRWIASGSVVDCVLDARIAANVNEKSIYSFEPSSRFLPSVYLGEYTA
jgi:hypothetical protein